MINGFVKGQSLKITAPTLVADSIKYLEAKFHFQTSDWDGFSKWVHFAKGEIVYDIKLNSENEVTENDNLNLSAGSWNVYLHGTNGDGKRITTEKERIDVKQSGALNGEPFPDIPLSAVEQIDNRVFALERAAQKNGKSSFVEFKTTAIELNFKVTGLGIFTVDFGDGEKETVEINGCHNFKHRYARDITEKTVSISGCKNLKELDVHRCNISEIVFSGMDSLEKLVAYENQIEKLDVYDLKNLQYLHIFGNEICKNKKRLLDLIRTLPDRSSKAFGSIIMYPFYPLGVLVYKNGNLITKYPNRKAVQPVFGEFYRDMNQETVVWYKYENGEFIEQKEQNFLINLRIDCEKETLQKKWLFGSAIQYDKKEYEKCGHYFKQNHIADYWETAEKGIGQTLGIYDFTAGQVLGFEKMNVKAYDAANGMEAEPREAKEYSSIYTHGDVILSATSSRGELLYGVAPDSDLYLIDALAGNVLDISNYANAVKRMTENSNVITNSFLPSADVYKEAKQYFAAFAKNNPLFSASGNYGDGKPWTPEVNYDVGNRYGSDVFMVNAIDQDKSYSSFSITQAYPEFSYRDAFSEYGANLKTYSAVFKDLYAENGTSIASPICAAVVLLMMNVYQKMNGASESYGKHSKFMNEFVRNHCDPLYHEMNMAVGNGRPDLMTFNRVVENGIELSVQVKDIVAENLIADQNGSGLNAIAYPENADNLELTYQHDMTKFAVYKNKVYPLNESGEEDTFIAHSNMTASVKKQFVVSSDLADVPCYEIEKLPIHLVDDGDAFKVEYPENTKDHTVQLLVNLEDVDPDEDIAESQERFLEYLGKKFLSILCAAHKKDVSGFKADKLTFLQTRGRDVNNAVIKCVLSAGGQWENLEGKTVVITFVAKTDSFVVYLNGNILATGRLEDVLKLENLRIVKQSLVNESKDSVRVYNEALSAEEVIRNSVALLNSNGKNPNGISHNSSMIENVNKVLAYGTIDDVLNEVIYGGYASSSEVNDLLQEIL